MIRLVVATANPGKLGEITAALEGLPVQVLGLDALEAPGAVEETGRTFEENARIKAEAYSRRTPHPVLADDSGLEVDALGGAPGIRSARYGGDSLDDAGRCRMLLRELQAVPPERRTARFRCALAVARRGRILAEFEGSVEGRILEEARGAGGFGYDPLFFHEAVGRTFAEIPRQEKQRLSHRGRALARFAAALREGRLVLGEGAGE